MTKLMDRCGCCNSPKVKPHCVNSMDNTKPHSTCRWKTCENCGAYGDPEKDLWAGGK